MKTHVLMYHDVIAPEQHQASGFPSADAALYKLSPEDFAAHLATLAETVSEDPAVAWPSGTEGQASWLITFDDGGASAHTAIAPALEARGWRGWFFMTTDYIGQAAFLSVAQLRDLHARGHVVGSHSCSHPERFSHLTPTAMRREWRDSAARLADVLGAAVTTASVPGGFYTPAVARAAAEAGLKILFTSEPTRARAVIDGCVVVGRYAVQRATAPRTAADLAAGKFLPAAQQALLWKAKKAAKRCGGTAYLKLRKTLLGAK